MSENPPPSDVPDRFAVDFTGVTLLGNFKVESKLAEGGMGAIYVGEDMNLGRKVVIKVPHVRFLGEPGFRGRFRQEISDLVRLEHPSIVRILAQGEHEDVPYFVLQYLGGGSLEDVFEAEPGPQSMEAVMGWLPTIASTLDFVHARGTVHRDVKPANIIFSDDEHVFLSDFGVAKALGNEDLNLTADGTGVGSPRYMAPEQAIGEDLTPAADQYALASMIYEALAGVPPFKGDTAIELLIAKKTDEPTPLDELVPGLPAPVAAAVMRGLSRAPGDRHESCQALVDEMTMRPEPPVVDEAPAPKGVSPWVPVLAILGLVLLGFGVLVTMPGDGEEPPGTSATNATESVRLTLVDPGAEPRRVFRYAPTAGTDETLRVRLHQTMTQTRGPAGGFPNWMNPPKTWELIVSVEAPNEDGDIRFSWRTEKLTMHFLDGTPENGKAYLQRVAAMHERFAGWALLTENGMNKGSELTVPEDTPDVIINEMQNLWWVLRNIATPFPVEPIGVGAKYELSESMEIVGMRVTHATTVTIDAIDGDTVTMTHDVAQTAPPRQPMDFGGAAKVKANLVSLHTNGTATNVLDLGSITPTRHDYEMIMRMELEVEPPPEPEGEAKPGEPVVRLNKGKETEAPAEEPKPGDPKITEGFRLVGQEIRLTLQMERVTSPQEPAPARK